MCNYKIHENIYDTYIFISLWLSSFPLQGSQVQNQPELLYCFELLPTPTASDGLVVARDTALHRLTPMLSFCLVLFHDLKSEGLHSKSNCDHAAKEIHLLDCKK